MKIETGWWEVENERRARKRARKKAQKEQMDEKDRQLKVTNDKCARLEEQMNKFMTN